MEFEVTFASYRCFTEEEPVRIRFGRALTAFVGPNNSGKSSVLRFFHDFRGLFRAFTDPRNFLEAIRSSGSFQQRCLHVLSESLDGVFSTLNSRPITVTLRLINATARTSAYSVADRIVVSVPRGAREAVAARVFQGARELTAEEPTCKITGEYEGDDVRADLKPLSDAFRLLADAMYIGPFRNVLNVQPNAEYFDARLGRSFVHFWRELKTRPDRTRNAIAYRVKEDIRTVFGLRHLEIDPSFGGDTLVVNVDGQSYKLDEMGSGLAQFIAVFGNAAMKQPSFLLIDEPELNLHPSLQLDFLTSLSAYAREGVVFATHSLGLARAADAVFAAQRRADGRGVLRPFEDAPRLSELLGELNFAGQRALGFSRVLLVEGVTEVKTFQQLLRKLRKDHQVAILSLGGGSLINGKRAQEIEEIRRVGADLFAIIDSERTAPGAPLPNERQEFSALCESMKIPCVILERRSTENYFTPRAISATLGNEFRELGPYERLRDAARPWSKEQNWRIAREITLEELKGTDLLDALKRL